MTIEEQLRLHEGFAPYPIFDPSRGRQIVGIGHVLDASPLPDEMYPMTEDRAMQLLRSKVETLKATLQARFSWFQMMDEVRQRVVVDMVFHLGVPTFRTFTTLIRALESGNYGEAADEIRCTIWAHLVGVRAVRLASWMRVGRESM